MGKYLERINFINNKAPWLNDINLNKLQENVEDAITKIEAECKTTVVDNLESTSQTDALSARQGKILKDKIQRHIITAKGNGASITATSSGSKVTLTEAITVGTKITLSNGGIKIGSNVQKISIEGTTVFTSGQTGQHGVYIYKNTKTETNLLARTMLNTANNADIQSNLNITRRIIDNVSEGDIIYLYVTSNINHEVSAPLSMLTVEVIE